MGYFGQLAQIGWYNAAYKILGAIVISAAIISKSFYPALSKLFKEPKENFLKIWGYQMGAMGIIAIPILVGGFILAPKIILFFYGSDYMPSIPIFRLLLFICVVDFIYYPYATVMAISNRQNKLFYIMLVGVTLNTVLTILLVPKYSYYGAAAAAI